MGRRVKAEDSLNRLADRCLAVDEIIAVLDARGLLGRKRKIGGSKPKKAPEIEVCPFDAQK
jgi:hypothetical protein